MLRLFQPHETAFLSNGDKVLDALKARVHCADNGDFYLDLETDLRYVNDLTEGRIVVAPTPQGDQPFRVANVERTKSKITTRAWHVFYDTERYLVEDSYVQNNNCNYALDHLNTAAEPASPFSTVSDVTSVNSYRCVRTSLYDAIQAVIERWGGHLVRDHFNIAIRSAIGTDNGVTVQYGKNLREITAQENWDNVVTKLLPTGKDGIMLTQVYVESERQYAIPFCKTVAFSQDYINKEDYADEAAYLSALQLDLYKQAEAYVFEHSVPEVNYTLRANLEHVTGIGDTVQVNDSRLGINLLTHVISYDYDCIAGRYVELEFGNFNRTLSDFGTVLTEGLENAFENQSNAIRLQLDAELEAATGQIWSALSDSNVIYNGNSIMIVDRLPATDAVNCILIDSAGIGFSNTGIHGTFNSAWKINGEMDMQQFNVINLIADLIHGGTLTLGGFNGENGLLELYNESNQLIGQMTPDGLKMYGADGSYVLMNNEVGFAGYDINGNKIYWVAQDEFHMRKSVVEEEITLCEKIRFIPITVMNGNTVVNDGVGIVAVAQG